MGFALPDDVRSHATSQRSRGTVMGARRARGLVPTAARITAAIAAPATRSGVVPGPRPSLRSCRSHTTLQRSGAQQSPRRAWALTSSNLQDRDAVQRGGTLAADQICAMAEHRNRGVRDRRR